MFIRLTYNKDAIYINVDYIEGFTPYVDYTKIWLADGDIIKVEETINQILKLIEEVRKNGN